jgi:CHAT domain-containing protein
MVQRADVLESLAQSQQQRGAYAESVEPLREALAIAEQAGDRVRIAAALGSLGNAHVALGEGDEAERLLAEGTRLAIEAGESTLAARLWNNLGNHYAVRGSPEEALRAYDESARLAHLAEERDLEAKALSNGARAALELGQRERAARRLEQSSRPVQSLEPGYETALVLIHRAGSHQRLASESAEHREASLLQAHADLNAATELSGALNASRLRSYALGNLGALYESEGRADEALYLTRLALAEAETADAAEVLYRWHWQEGRLLWQQGRAQRAIEAYRRAVMVLEETRQEALARYGAAAVSFRRLVAPVYLDLVDALLQGSAMVSDSRAATRLLMEARSVVEQLKAAELRDYFRDECIAELEAKAVAVESVSSQAAVVYPILLPERTELLVSLPSGLRRYPVPVTAERMRAEVGSFRDLLEVRSTREYLPSAQQLYDWLVRPYAEDLAEEGVDTLIFVPDGPLRTIPMAALNDGTAFLAEHYALAVTPTLSLLAPAPLTPLDARILLAGVSQSVQGFAPLPEVPAELAGVQALYGGEILLDEEFRLSRLEEEMAGAQPAIVHIASHAEFTGDPRTSFLLTHNGRLSMDGLGELVRQRRFREDPLELLVLSACDTAAGDERAALGLAGVAIGAGARSALGSLWAIADVAATDLVLEFYRQLEDPSVSKAMALQRAQRTLLEDPRFSHPFYWSAFLVISNWL